MRQRSGTTAASFGQSLPAKQEHPISDKLIANMTRLEALQLDGRLTKDGLAELIEAYSVNEADSEVCHVL